jgi:hypothetical protein
MTNAAANKKCNTNAATSCKQSTIQFAILSLFVTNLLEIKYTFSLSSQLPSINRKGPTGTCSR